LLDANGYCAVIVGEVIVDIDAVGCISGNGHDEVAEAISLQINIC